MKPNIFKMISTIVLFLSALVYSQPGICQYATIVQETTPHVGLSGATHTLDSSGHYIQIRLTGVSSMLSYNSDRDIQLSMVNEGLNTISVQFIDISGDYMNVYITPNLDSLLRNIVIQGSEGGFVIVNQYGGTYLPESEQPPFVSEEKLSISGNWKLHRTYTDTQGSRYEDITFYNGLGYPEQRVNVCASATGNHNIVTPIIYDARMRGDAKVYLPFVSAHNTTAMQEHIPLQMQNGFYTAFFGSSDAEYAYRENVYEASPLNRKLAQWESGSAHRNAGKKTTIEYGTNTVGEVCLLEADATSNTLTIKGCYNACTLHKITTTDADGGVSVIYTDLSGNTVLERVTDTTDSSSATSTAAHNHDTYYAYNVYGNLCWVITPEGSALLANGASFTTESAFAKQHCYTYKYDGRGNIVEKRQPGKEPEYFVYDKGNRNVLYQNGNMRLSGEWIYTVWDNLNRQVEKNIITTTLSREELHNYYNNTSHSNQYYYQYGASNPNLPMKEDEYRFGNNIYSSRYYGYRYRPILSSTTQPQSIEVMDGVYFMVHAYLDIPSFMQLSLYDLEGIYIGADEMIRDEYFICTDGEIGLEYYYIPQGYMDIIETMIQEDPTATLELVYEFPTDGVPASSVTLTGESYYEDAPTANLPFHINALCSSSDLDTLHNTGQLQYERYLLLQQNTSASPAYKETAHYYNNLSQLIQSVTRYPHSDSLHRISYRYTFTGEPASILEEYNGITKRTDYTYDKRCRLISATTTVGRVAGQESGTAETVASATITYTYNTLGELTGKTYGNGVTETISHNIQGWQTESTVRRGGNNIYRQSLKYYNPQKGTTPLYTGNISEWSTTMGSQTMNTYGFEYDKLRRLKNTNNYIGAGTTPTAAYTERGITYDKNGNIKTLERYGADNQNPEIDYQYDYIGNQLTSIGNGENDGCVTFLYPYEYDSNGNLTHDGLKNLQISYNFLNLPSVVSQASTPAAEYTWFADGSKYSVLDNSNIGYYYIGSLIYASNNGNLQIESTDFSGGRINFAAAGANSANGAGNTESASAPQIHYFHADHLGSIRAITDQDGEVIEQNAYYPFGSRHTFGSTYAQTTNRFKFNGKEKQTTGNLNYLDYGARMYDANIGRWTTQDPLAEKYYPYSPYNYCGGNPVLRIDYEGKFWETAWDAASLTMGLKSLMDNIRKRNIGAAIADGAGVIIDAAAAVTPFVPGGVGAAISAVRVADKVDDIVDAGKALNTVDNAADAASEGKVIVISIDDSNKIGKDLLNPPLKRGNAPTFKSDNTPVEIHHQGQNSDGPFKEMHKVDHRGKGNYKTNHPEHTNKSNIDRKQFDKARIEYWKYEYDNWNNRPN